MTLKKNGHNFFVFKAFLFFYGGSCIEGLSFGVSRNILKASGLKKNVEKHCGAGPFLFSYKLTNAVYRKSTTLRPFYSVSSFFTHINM